MGKVMHSQRLKEKNLTPWIICDNNGNICSAHCDCVAGLGEVCTHVCAVLFEIDQVVRATEATTRTGVKAYWMPPTSKPSDPAPIANLDLRTPKKRHHEEVSMLKKAKTANIDEVSNAEKLEFLRKIKESTSRGSVLHLVTSPFAEEIKLERQKKEKWLITSLYRKEYETKSLEELQNIGLTLDLHLTVEQCKQIELETKLQAKCPSWFSYRAGRITASKFKQCTRTSLEKPLLSLIKTICYPSTYKLGAKSLVCGCQHEKKALNAFVAKMKKKHRNFNVEPMGFFINPTQPYFGVSPDGVVECDCCGMSLVEVKCPYCARNSSICDLIELKSFFFKAKDGEIILKEDHVYYYQIQMQLAITGSDFCYLVVWSPKDLVSIKIEKNDEFWRKESENIKNFFFKIILPEVLGEYFTRKAIAVEEKLQSPIEVEVEEEWDLDPVWDEVVSGWENVDLYEEVLPSTSGTSNK